jgi:hypothetical protein
MDKLADGLQKLNEDDLLQVVQMVHDHKAADSYTKNDVERKSNPVNFLANNSLFFVYFLNKQPTHNPSYSRRIPRRPLYPPRRTDKNALGFHSGARSPLKGLTPSQEKKNA